MFSRIRFWNVLKNVYDVCAVLDKHNASCNEGRETATLSLSFVFFSSEDAEDEEPLPLIVKTRVVFMTQITMS